MTELDAALVRRKLALIVENIEALAEIEGISLKSYIADRFRLKGTERLLQETIEAAVDINLHLLRAKDFPVPPDYHASFIEMGERGLIPKDLAERLAPRRASGTAWSTSTTGSTTRSCWGLWPTPDGGSGSMWRPSNAGSKKKGSELCDRPTGLEEVGLAPPLAPGRFEGLEARVGGGPPLKRSGSPSAMATPWARQSP